MVRYTIAEKNDMYLVYIQCRRNSLVASEVYQQKFPERRQPSLNIFLRLYRNMQSSGSLQQKRRKYNVVREAVNEINVLAQITNNPEIGSREVARQCSLSKTAVQKILKKHKYHDFKYKPVQTLHDGDNHRRLQFCNWFQNETARDPEIAKQIIWTDETLFTNSGIYNRKNSHYYSIDNPHLMREVRPQVRFSINVWCGLVSNKVLGPYFINNNSRLTSTIYLDFLENDFEDYLDIIPLAVLRKIKFFQHDGAGPHNGQIVRHHLDTRFRNSWIGTHGPVAWPPRSPDLNPLDYGFWGMLKDKIYSSPILNEQQLQEQIVTTIRSVDPSMIEKIVLHMNNRVNLCIQVEGGHFEQLL